jgi:hypothetical protein
MPRVKNVIPTNETRVTEIGTVGRANKKTGRTEWSLERQSVGEVSGKVYDQVALDDTAEDGTVTAIVAPNKGCAEWFIKGYNYARSELEEE